MKRKFNYTGRKRIPREKIFVALNQFRGSIQSFVATLDLEDMELPSDAKIYVEAYHRTEFRRFDFGTVGKVTPPASTRLDIGYAESLRFRVLVVENGIVLASAERIRPISEGDTRSILPVDMDDLGQQIWRVDYSGEEDSPVLVLNKNILNILNTAKLDPQFFFHVFPTAIKEILTHMVFMDGVDDMEDPSIDWHRDWLEFSKKFSGGLPQCLNPKADNFTEEVAEEVEEWIDNVVKEFCAAYPGRWAEYIRGLEAEK